MSKSPKRKLAVLDLETDPFQFGKVIQPFLAAYWDGRNTHTYWSPNCVEELVRKLEKEAPSLIYAHNGGRFDFHYLLPYLSSSEIKVINGSIVEARLGKHIIRDSYKILPFSLRKYDKLEIDVKKFRKDLREKHKDEIILYNHRDLTALYELVSAFRADFGNALTIGMAAIKELEKFHPFKRGNQHFDAYFRKFYYGARVQVFEPGITTGHIQIIDVNSMYPYAMASVKHPIGLGHTLDTRITKSTVFLVVEGTNDNAFPIRTKEGLDFQSPYGVYHVTIHEFQAAMETGRFKLKRILKTYNWRELGTFDQFVHTYIAKRQAAIQSGDRIHDLLYKFLLNSSYGKFAQNPAKYFDWCFARDDEPWPFEWHTCTKNCVMDPTTSMCPQKWYPASFQEGWFFFKKVARKHSYFNVATGASITGAARAILLRALHQTPHPLYCDTDSIIYKGSSGASPIHPTQLGAWKVEAIGDRIAIGGKKTYAVFKKDKCLKMAHKGMFDPKPSQIVRIAQGETIVNRNPVPKFHIDGPPTFTERKIRATARTKKK